MKKEPNTIEDEVLSALTDAVEGSVLATESAHSDADAPAKRRLPTDALPASATEPGPRARRTDLSKLSLDEAPEERSAEELEAAEAARKAAREALAADPKLRAADERAAAEAHSGHRHHHHPTEERPQEDAPPAAEEPKVEEAADEIKESETSTEAIAEEAPSTEEAPSEEAAEAVETEAPADTTPVEETQPEAEEAAEPAPAAGDEQAEAVEPAPAETEAPALSIEAAEKKEKKPRSKAARIITGTLLVLLETILLLVVALYGIMFILTKGPSGTASRLFVRSVRETSAIGFLANLYFSEEEIQALIANTGESEYVETNTDLITMTSIPENAAEPDAWGFVDEDGDGIILDEVKGEGYSGYMMIVLDPSRVILGSNPAMYGSRGYTVEEFVHMYDAVAGINGGAFQDENGMGTGAYPEGLVIYEGQAYNWGVKQGFAGIDSNHILHVGCQSLEDAIAADIQYGASYGPVLVQNGQMTGDDTLESGLNPRTAIGQRQDGAFLLLVIDGRQVISLGATYLDEAEIMLRYGAVNAINLDGGSSSMMYYNDGYVNNSASVIGIRPIPTSFIVLKEGRS